MRIGELRPVWERGAGWWDGRSGREQLLLGALGVIAALGLLLLVVVRPLQAERDDAVAALRSYDMIDARLRTAGPITAVSPRRGPPATIISETAAGAGLTVQRIEPQGARLNLVLADAPFASVLHFVSELESRSTLRVSEARIERSTIGGGQVSAQFLLAGG